MSPKNIFHRFVFGYLGFLIRNLASKKVD